MTLVGVGHALADAFAFVGEDVPKTLGLHPGSFNQVPDYRMRAILLTLKEKTLMAGGSAANVVKLAARLGLRTHFVGQCGHDDVGHLVERELLEAGVRVNLTRTDAPTGLCVTFLAPGSDRTIATFRSASGDLPVGLVGEALLREADLVITEGYLLDEPEFLIDLAERCRREGRMLSLDVAEGTLTERHYPTLQTVLASGVVKTLFLAEADAAGLTGADAEGALAALGQSAEHVVLRRGDRGWLTASATGLVAIPLASTNDVDPSGMGDGFQAGFFWALARGWSRHDACRAGALVAAAVAEEPGTRVDPIRWSALQAELAALPPA